MPIYEFICRDCGNKFEELVRLEEETINCPKCSSKNSQKILSLISSKGTVGGKLCPPSCKGLNCGDCN